MVSTRKRRKQCEKLVQKFWHKLRHRMGDDPFAIAAEQSISIMLHHEEENGRDDKRVAPSRFDPEALTIEIFVEALTRFWKELFPGCPLALQYRYVCWQELWSYWHSHQFAPIYHVLGKEWKEYMDQFSGLSQAEKRYFSHYFASVATGVLKENAA